MNLNYGYDKAALTALINTADSSLYEHNLVIDFDGEVIIDPQVHYPNVPLEMYKFCTTIRNKALQVPMMANALYDSLEMIFERLNTQDELEIGLCKEELRIAA